MANQACRQILHPAENLLAMPLKGGLILSVYRDNGKENGNYYDGFRI